MALREMKVTRVFRAWVEDWEKEAIKSNDAVAEVRLLEKYKDLRLRQTRPSHSTPRRWSGIGATGRGELMGDGTS